MLNVVLFLILGLASFGVLLFYFLYEVYKEIDED